MLTQHENLNTGMGPISANPLLTTNLQADFRQEFLRHQKFADYGIDPAKVTVISPNGTTLGMDKELALEKLLEAYELALKHKQHGNYSGRFYVTLMHASDGSSAAATNVEFSRDRLMCGERAAATKLVSEILEHSPDPSKDVTVTHMFMTGGHKPFGEDDSVYRSCGDCLSWMTTDKYFSPDTKIISPKKLPSGELALQVLSIKELAPHHHESMEPSTSEKTLRSLPIDFSDKAREVIKAEGITRTTLRNLLSEAKHASEHVSTAEFSGSKNGSAVLLSNGDINQGNDFEWSARWRESGDMLGAATGFQKAAGSVKDLRVRGVAYYGDGKELPPIASLARLAQAGRGGTDLLVVRIDNDRIEVKTALDYMPYMYVSSSFSGKKS